MPQSATAQTAGNAQFELIDKDGNNYADIGDSLHVRVDVNNTVPGTNVQADLSAYGQGTVTLQPTPDSTDADDGDGTNTTVTFADTVLSAAGTLDGQVFPSDPEAEIDITVNGSASDGVENLAFNVNAPSEIDNVGPGSVSIDSGILDESSAAVENDIGNPNEQLETSISGLNGEEEDSYDVYVFNPQFNTDYDTTASGDLAASAIVANPTVSPGQTADITASIGSFLPDEGEGGAIPGIDAGEGSNSAKQLQYTIRDEAGNESTASATPDFAIDNVVPSNADAQGDSIITATVTLSADNDPQGIAGQGDELTVSVSQDSFLTDISEVYLRVPENRFGDVGQQEFTDIDVSGTDVQQGLVLQNDGSGNYVATVPLIDDTGDFPGLETGSNSLRFEYELVDDAGNGIVNQYNPPGDFDNEPETDPLAEPFDNVEPSLANAVVGPLDGSTNPALDDNNDGFGIRSGTEVVLSITEGDLTSATADLTALGGNAQQSLSNPSGNLWSYTLSDASGSYDVQVTDRTAPPQQAEVNLSLEDDAGNDISGLVPYSADGSQNSFTYARTEVIDLVEPSQVSQSQITVDHTDSGASDVAEGNDIINIDELVRVTIDVSDNPDFASVSGGSGAVELDLSAFGNVFGNGMLTVEGTDRYSVSDPVPPPSQTGFGYDPANERFVVAFEAEDGGVESDGSGAIVVQDVRDNAENAVNPNDDQSLYANLDATFDGTLREIDTLPVQFTSTDYGFSSSTDENGDGIAGIGDGVQVSASVSGADSVVADLRVIGQARTNMSGSGGTYSVTADVDTASSPQFASEDTDNANPPNPDPTSIQIIAFDASGNRSTAGTPGLRTDNTMPTAPEVQAEQASDGRIELQITQGSIIETRDGQADLSYDSDVFQGISGTGVYEIYSNGGSGDVNTRSPVATVQYSGPATTYTTTSFSDGDEPAFRVKAVDNTGNGGMMSQKATQSADVSPDAISYVAPSDSTVVGTSGAYALEVEAGEDIADGGSITFRARAVDVDPNTSGDQAGDWFTVGGTTPNQSGQLFTQSVNAADFLNFDDPNNNGDEAVGNEYQVVARATDASGNTQTDSEALSTNGSFTAFADNQAPVAELTAIDDSTFNGIDTNTGGIASTVDVDASGETEFTFRVSDQFALKPALARVDFAIPQAGINLDNTVAEHVAAGVASVQTLGDGSLEVTVTADLSSLNDGSVASADLEVSVGDGRGNPSGTLQQSFTVADERTGEQQLAVGQSVIQRQDDGSGGTDRFFDISLFTDDFDFATTDLAEYRVYLSASSDLTSPVKVGTFTSPGFQTVIIPESVSLTDGETYHVFAEVQDPSGNSVQTNAVSILYDETAPTASVSFPDAQMVGGMMKVSGTTELQLETNASDVSEGNINVTVRGSNGDSYTSAPISTPSGANPFVRSFNTEDAALENQNALLDRAELAEYTAVVRIQVADDAGNQLPPIERTIRVDNRPPAYTVTSVNGDSTLSSLQPVNSGDSIEVVYEVDSDDVASGQFLFDDGSTFPERIEGIVERTGTQFAVTYPIPEEIPENETFNMTPGAAVPHSVSFVDSLGNEASRYQGSSIGSITVLSDAQPSAVITSLEDGYQVGGSGIPLASTPSAADEVASVRYELQQPNSENWETLASGNTDQTVNFDAGNYSDGDYNVRAVAITENDEEFASEPVSITIDNTNNGDSERAEIVDLQGARIGGGSLMLQANAGEDVAAVQFQARFADGSTGWVTLGETVVGSENTFSQTFSAEEIRSGYGVGSLSQLDGVHEFRAVASDSTNYDLVDYPTFGTSNGAPTFSTGNADNPQEVATTRAEVDLSAPNGLLALDGSELSDAQNDSWANQNLSDYNLLDDETSHNFTARVTGDDEGDFEEAQIRLQRLEAEDPGSGAPGAYEAGGEPSEETTVATLTEDELSSGYTINTDDLAQGGLYRVTLYLSDDLGNIQQVDSYTFVANQPRAFVAGYNAEHQTLLIQGDNFAKSAMLEVSTDGGNSYTTLQTVNLTDVGSTTDGRDNATWAQVRIDQSDIPTGGTAMFRVTAASVSANSFSARRFGAQTTLSLDVGDDGSWSPTSPADNDNIAASDVPGLSIDANTGELDDVNLEVRPASDQTTVAMVADTDVFSTDNALNVGVFPEKKAAVDFGAVPFDDVLSRLDGSFLGFSRGLNLAGGDVNILNGGSYHTFAANVTQSGAVALDVEGVSVEPVSANNGGTVASADSNFIATFGQNVLDANGAVFVEPDPTTFRSSKMNQQDLGQIGDAYHFEGYGANIRSGYTAELTIAYDEDDIVDANQDGTVDSEDEALLSVAEVDVGNQEFEFDAVVDKSVDTTANEVHFTVDDLSGARYTLVLQNANQANPGTMTVDALWVDDRETGLYSDTFPNFRAVVSDDVAGIDASTAQLWIDGTSVDVNANNVLGASNAIKFESDSDVGELDLQEGSHSARFVVENSNGNRIDRMMDFVIDDTDPFVQSETALVGAEPEISFTIGDAPAGDTTGSGVDRRSVFVDVYATTTVETDTAGAVEIQQGIVRLSPDELNFSGPTDSTQVSFSLVDNLDGIDFNGFELVVHDARSGPSFSAGTLLSAMTYSSNNGLVDSTGNQGATANFRVTSDKKAPELEVLSRTVQSGLRVRVTDEKAGVDTTGITVTETIDGESSEYGTSASAVSYNSETGILTFTPQEVGSAISVSVTDRVGNTATTDFLAQSENLTVSDFHNFPNPFDPTTSAAQIVFELSKSATVTIEAYDQVGRHVRTLVDNQSMDAGENTLDFVGRSDGGDLLGNGVYFLRLVAKDGDRTVETTFKSVIAK